MKQIYKAWWFWVAILIIIGILVYVVFYKTDSTPAAPETNLAFNDYKSASYEIDGTKVSLKDESIRYFGNEAWGDFNNDGSQDVAFTITQDNGGSGTFYYVVAALNNGNRYIGTNGIFLGDRIAPQTTEFRNNEIIVNYATRGIDEPMTAYPSIGVSKYLRIENGRLLEIIN